MAGELLPPLLERGDPASASGYGDHPPRMGFFTDTSVCIGCKACEVACKEWNHVPEDGLKFTGMSFRRSRKECSRNQAKPMKRSAAAVKRRPL